MAILHALDEDLQDDLDEFYELLARAKQVMPMPAPPPTVTSGVVRDGKWVK